MNASKFDILSLVRDASFHVSHDVYEKLLAKAEALSHKSSLGYSLVVIDVLTALPGRALASVSKFSAMSECWIATCYGGSYGDVGRASMQELLQIEMGDEEAVASVQCKIDMARVACIAT